MRKITKISTEQRTQLLVNLLNKNALPVRARKYSDDIIKSHMRGMINDPNIEKELEAMGLVEKELESQEL